MSGIFRPLREWGITISATLASTYVLDVIATICGLGAALLPWAKTASFGAALAFLLVSYVAWGVCLSVNLRANRLLLAATGTSTNAVSKLLYDLAAHRKLRPRLQGLAADVGYVGMELAKEAPYYLSAAGLALATESVSATDAMIFLGGANFGAALYEYGLARAVRCYLGPSGQRPADFSTDWSPRTYLQAYYSKVDPDEEETLRAFVAAMRQAPPGRPVLIFGCGPTVHHACLAAPHSGQIDMCDFLPGNLAAVEDWVKDRSGVHDWRPFVRRILQLETGIHPDDAAMLARMRLARSRIGRLCRADMLSDPPIPEIPDARYGTVIAAYCADSATSVHREWQAGMARIAALVEPGGLLLVAALDQTHAYRVGHSWFPSANLSIGELHHELAQHFDPETISVCRKADLLDGRHGYTGILLASARRPYDAAARSIRLRRGLLPEMTADSLRLVNARRTMRA